MKVILKNYTGVIDMMKQEEMKNWEPLGIDSTNEEGMLEQMNVNVGIALNEDNRRHEAGEYEPQFIYIAVNDEIHKFLLGGPQVAGLDAFIEMICKENGYNLPWGEL